MSDRKKRDPCKPPVPARPKNLVILNSKHLPKPPETFLSEKVTDIIKDFNIDDKDASEEEKKEKIKNSGQRFENSDSEEDNYVYLEPVSLSAGSSIGINNNDMISTQKQHKKPSYEENLKFGDSLRRFNSRSGSISSETRSMWEDFFFYLKLAKPMGANLGRRLTHEMADFGFNFKRRLRKAVKGQVDTEKRYFEVIPEASEIDESKHQFLQPQWQRPLPSLPLPPVETKSVVVGMPWYRNVDRNKGEEILMNGVDGCFLVRPSSNPETYLTLTLWHNTRVYNIPIRKRKDGKFALGTPKTREQCFDSVECLVKNYQSEKLVLYSNGVQTGKTLLTTYPHPD